MVRRSSELAGLPAPSQELEELRAKEIVLEKQEQHKTVKVDLDSPVFETKGGVYDCKVLISFRAIAEAQIRFSIERVEVSSAGAAQGSRSVNFHSPLYRRPFELDRPGTYIVNAVAFRQGPSDVVYHRSLAASERFVVTPGASGTRLRDLPSQMVKGVVKIAHGTHNFLNASLGSLRTAIAQASHALESAVHLQVSNRNGQAPSIDFSVEVDDGMDATGMSAQLTDSSLVASIAEVLRIDASSILVEAEANKLEEVLLSLSWLFPQSRYGVPRQADYLDGSCLIYSETKLLDVVDYRGPQSLQNDKCSSASGWSAGSGQSAAVLHSGDVMTDTGGNHALRVYLSRLPCEATDCIFTLSAYNCQDLSRFVAPSMHIFNAECPGHVLTNYSVADAGTASAVVVCSLTRRGNVWSVRAHARTSAGTVRDYTPIEGAISRIQSRYENSRRRMKFVLVYRLWQEHRAIPRGTECAGEDDVLLPLLDIEPEIFKCIVGFV